MRTPVSSATAEITIHKSVFVATVHPVSTEIEVRDRISAVRAEHPKANHVVWAFAVGPKNSQRIGMTDDHEPKGTAGRPALSVLQHLDLTNILVTIVRYFGGVKLGKGGLVRAYTGSAQAAIQVSRCKELVEESAVTLVCGYSDYEPVRRLLVSAGAEISGEDFGTDVILRCSMFSEGLPDLEQRVQDLTGGRVMIQVT
jgi:uncharacterized YigZ family protein